MAYITLVEMVSPTEPYFLAIKEPLRPCLEEPPFLGTPSLGLGSNQSGWTQFQTVAILEDLPIFEGVDPGLINPSYYGGVPSKSGLNP